jgi:hypothetical protein
MIKILRETLGLDERNATYVLIGMLIFTAFYTTISGLWGVLVTDLFQFALKMGMVILLAVLAVTAVGGIDALKTKIAALDATSGQAGSRLDFFPGLDSAWMPAITLFVYLAVNWWASWYPGAEPGGGGYVAQRIFSAKDERHGVLATLWFNTAPMAVDFDGTRFARPLSGTGGQGVGLHSDNDGSECLPALPARFHAGGIRCRLHVHHRHATELGRVVCHQ